MAVCREIKSFSRTHERIADFFSLLAVAVLFGSIWVIVTQYQRVWAWIQLDLPVHTAMVIALLVADVLLILAFLAIGSARFGEDSERCFGTFRGRRSQRSSVGLFSAWISHMENVGKKHR